MSSRNDRDLPIFIAYLVALTLFAIIPTIGTLIWAIFR